MATAWMPDRNIESAMMPGSSRLLYCSGMYPLVVMTRPKMKTSSIGCSSVCRSSGRKLRRATRPSRPSSARKVLKFMSEVVGGRGRW